MREVQNDKENIFIFFFDDYVSVLLFTDLEQFLEISKF
jgi:hypothetical protein